MFDDEIPGPHPAPNAALAWGMTLLLTLLPAIPTRANEAPAEQTEVRRVSTGVPFPRGLVLKDGTLYALSRGRVRDSGGVDTRLDDRAGTLWAIDPTVAVPLGEPGGGAAATNGRVFAEPTSPPFRLLDRSLPKATDDRDTDRPYCVLRWHEGSKSFYICAFSGIDLAASDPASAEAGSFRKNFSDAVLRYDTRTEQWSELDRHDPTDGATYPGKDDRGPLKGPDNLLAVGDALIVAAKDNDRLVAYDLSALNKNPDAAVPPGRVILGDTVTIEGEPMSVLGHSGLAYRDGWLYVAFRTTSQVIRVPVTNPDPASFAVDASRAEMLARFDPFERGSKKPSANLTDIALGPDGDVYVVSAYPARVYRFAPDPTRPRDFTSEGDDEPWCDLAEITGNDAMKSENLLVADDGRVFVTSGDAYGHGAGLGGAIYVIEASR